MNKTLAIDFSFLQKNPNSLKEIESALQLSIFDRFQFSLKSSKGDLLDKKDISKLFNIVGVALKYTNDLVFSVACYEDSNNLNENCSVCEANLKGSKLQLSRICPYNVSYRQKLIDIVSDIYNQLFYHDKGIIHLAYFRYENMNQCVCHNCLEGFTSYLSSRNISFYYENYKTLVSHNIIAHWVHWRQDIITEALKRFSEACKKRISLEIDFDETKRYLAGPAIEEGLYLPKLVPYLQEVYIHIEPLNPEPDYNFHGRKEQKDSYLRHLKYIISICKQSDVKSQFFYWFLSEEHRIKENIRKYLSLANSAKPEGVVFYTNKPFALAMKLADLW